jgi:hypothetical protein
VGLQRSSPPPIPGWERNSSQPTHVHIEIFRLAHVEWNVAENEQVCALLTERSLKADLERMLRLACV